MLTWDTQSALNHLYVDKTNTSLTSTQSQALSNLAAEPFYDSRKFAEEASSSTDYRGLAQRFKDTVGPGLEKVRAYLDACKGTKPD